MRAELATDVARLTAAHGAALRGALAAGLGGALAAALGRALTARRARAAHKPRGLVGRLGVPHPGDGMRGCTCVEGCACEVGGSALLPLPRLPPRVPRGRLREGWPALSSSLVP
ncbi:hypothetical protein ABPG77_008241 [Micractinium sp. CCAP 211/92]